MLPRSARTPRSSVALQVGVAVQAAAGLERDRVHDPRVRKLGPRCLRQVEHFHARECLLLALGRLRTQPLVDLLLGDPFKLPVVVEQAHARGPQRAAGGGFAARAPEVTPPLNLVTAGG